jgi:hypothetical protein
MFTQPAIAGGYLPAGVTNGGYSPYTFGMKAQQVVTPGGWYCTLDKSLKAGTYIVQCSVVDASISRNIACTMTIADGSFQFQCLDKVDEPVDGGIMVTVYPVPLNR